MNAIRLKILLGRLSSLLVMVFVLGLVAQTSYGGEKKDGVSLATSTYGRLLEAAILCGAGGGKPSHDLDADTLGCTAADGGKLGCYVERGGDWGICCATSSTGKDLGCFDTDNPNRQGGQGINKKKHQGGQGIATVKKGKALAKIKKLLGSKKGSKALGKTGTMNDEALDDALGARPMPPKAKDAPQITAPPSKNMKGPKDKLPATVVVIPADKKAGAKASAATTVAPKVTAPATKKAGPNLKPAPVTGKKAPVAPVARAPLTKAPSPGAVVPNSTPPKIIESKPKVAPQ